MSLPTSLMADGIEKTLRLIHKALLTRTEGLGYRAHGGIPSPDNLPDEKVGVWIAPLGIDPQQQNTPFNATYVVSRWTVSLIRRESGSKAYDTDYFEVYRDSGRLFESLTATIEDMGLDGSVDFILEPRIQFFEGQPAGGNKQIVGFELTLEAHHPLFPCRAG